MVTTEGAPCPLRETSRGYLADPTLAASQRQLDADRQERDRERRVADLIARVGAIFGATDGLSAASCELPAICAR